MSSKNDVKLIYFSGPPRGIFLEKPMGKARFCVPEGIGLNIQDGTLFGTPNQEGILKMSSWKRVPKWCRPEILIREAPRTILLRFPKVFVSFAPEIGFGAKIQAGPHLGSTGPFWFQVFRTKRSLLGYIYNLVYISRI